MQEINLTQFLDIRNNTIFGFDRFINGQVLKDIIAKNPDALYVIGDERTKKIAMGAFDYVFNEDNFNIKNIKIHHKIATLENMAIMHSRSLQNVYFDSPNLALPNTFCYDFSSGNPINFHFHPENKPNYLVLVSIVDYGHSVSHPAVQRQQTPTGAWTIINSQLCDPISNIASNGTPSIYIANPHGVIEYDGQNKHVWNIGISDCKDCTFKFNNITMLGDVTPHYWKVDNIVENNNLEFNNCHNMGITIKDKIHPDATFHLKFTNCSQINFYLSTWYLYQDTLRSSNHSIPDETIMDEFFTVVQLTHCYDCNLKTTINSVDKSFSLDHTKKEKTYAK